MIMLSPIDDEAAAPARPTTNRLVNTAAPYLEGRIAASQLPFTQADAMLSHTASR